MCRKKIYAWEIREGDEICSEKSGGRFTRVMSTRESKDGNVRVVLEDGKEFTFHKHTVVPVFQKVRDSI